MMKFGSTRCVVKPFAGLAAGLCMLLAAPDADAQRIKQQSSVGFDKSSSAFEMQARLSIGLLDGEANEYVYWPEYNNHQASRLIFRNHIECFVDQYLRCFSCLDDKNDLANQAG